jgi:hypothetical protein
MLTKGDDYPIHQTPEPIAYAGSDRNFYDRYFFNAYGPDGEAFLAVAFGVYPALNVADAHFAVAWGGRERCLHASRVLGLERMDLFVGPIRIEVVEPLRTLKVIVEKADGIAAEITFDGRAFPIEEPRFVKRNGARLYMDYTRLTQNARVSGWVEVDGERRTLDGWLGTRDRSWGIRPVGLADPQANPGAGAFGFYWQWTPVHFEDRSVFFHVNEDADGHAWNTRAVILPDGAPEGGGWHTDAAKMQVELIPGTRHPRSGVLTIPLAQGEATVRFDPPSLTFLMRGLGYQGPWRHGAYRGDLVVEREDFDCAGFDLQEFTNLHTQNVCRLTLSMPGEPDRAGLGVFEQVILGSYRPLGIG